MNLVKHLVDDLRVLKTIWFSTITGDSHKERLENFYGPQADAYDHFRARFLHGRRGMLKACAKKINDLDDRPGLVWVDLGGGTGENVDMMAEYVDLSKFEKVYVVDICGPLCEVARKRVKARGWKNVEVVEADVCEFEPESRPATLVTFSYSLSIKPSKISISHHKLYEKLCYVSGSHFSSQKRDWEDSLLRKLKQDKSKILTLPEKDIEANEWQQVPMIPPFMTAVDKALSYLDPNVGILGVADFYTSQKYDSSDRQHGYLTRWFWRAIFDLDGIDLGPERRLYLDHSLDRVYEENKAGGIPYVPFIKPPYYIWLGRVRHHEAVNGN